MVLIAIFKFPIHFLIVAYCITLSIYISVMSTASANDFYSELQADTDIAFSASLILPLQDVF